MSLTVTPQIRNAPHGGHPGIITGTFTWASTYAARILTLADFGVSWLTLAMVELANFICPHAANNYRVIVTNYLKVTGVTTAEPAVVTTEIAHGLATGDIVTIADNGGATDSNGTWPITVTAADKFSIPVEETGTFSSGGTVTPAKRKPNWLGVLRLFNGATEASSTQATTSNFSLHLNGQ